MNVLVTTSTFGEYSDAPIRKLEESGFSVTLNPYKRKLAPEEAIKLLSGLKPAGIVAGTEKMSAEVMEAGLPELRVISRAGVGWDNVDLESAKKLGIKVFRTPDAPTEAAAELAVGLMLAVMRKISVSDRQIRGGKWKPLMGNLLSGKTVGIIGLGRIGRHVAKIVSAGFGAEVAGFDPYLDASVIPPHVKKRVSSLKDLLACSDIVSIHVPGGAGTDRLVGAGEIAIMPQGAVLINTSRGGVVDEQALFEALNTGGIAGAGLDVFEKEPYNGPLCGLDNTVCTAHMGSYAVEARVRMETEAVENLLAGLKGGA